MIKLKPRNQPVWQDLEISIWSKTCEFANETTALRVTKINMKTIEDLLHRIKRSL